MDLSSLKNTPGARTSYKRVGRGRASGMGKTSTRGTKGQQSRKGHKVKLGFEGGQMPLLRRLPKRGFKNPNHRVLKAVNLEDLEQFENGTEINREFLHKNGLCSNKFDGVKILGDGDLTKKLTFKVDAVSASAKAKIEAAGGTITLINQYAPEKKPNHVDTKAVVARKAAAAKQSAAKKAPAAPAKKPAAPAPSAPETK